MKYWEGRETSKEEDSWEIMLWEEASLLGLLRDEELVYPQELEIPTKATWNISGRELKHANKKEET